MPRVFAGRLPMYRRPERFSGSTQGGSRNHEQHPCLLSSQNIAGLDYSYPGKIPVVEHRHIVKGVGSLRLANVLG